MDLLLVFVHSQWDPMSWEPLEPETTEIRKGLVSVCLMNLCHFWFSYTKLPGFFSHNDPIFLSISSYNNNNEKVSYFLDLNRITVHLEEKTRNSFNHVLKGEERPYERR